MPGAVFGDADELTQELAGTVQGDEKRDYYPKAIGEKVGRSDNGFGIVPQIGKPAGDFYEKYQADMKGAQESITKTQ